MSRYQTIDVERYGDLLKKEAQLELLEAGGVDNWDWIGESLYGDHLDKDLHKLEEEIDEWIREELEEEDE